MGNIYIKCKGFISGLREFKWFCYFTLLNFSLNWFYNLIEVVVLSYDLN